ncbi:Bop3p Ecym_3308 [Eremothecium cymbalariae DBVPG|uniref:Uncharacterized protein n=1 Tax=Eremothecium cymbalariae (strain CBS 270.75 / DBVPG 7215 / KCTC 17166 / NRRL Y-17582) TaxID=931890 RepID=G8JRN0_ERECY|nr:Hypothetical protein Ecym_3308 [Eremothecium cymbalariae DBVPG\
MEPSSPIPAISSLLGPQVTSWPYSETSLIHALELKVEQEKTKQQYYRLENVSRSIDLVKIAIDAHVPGNSIPLLFNNNIGEEKSTELLETLATAGRTGRNVFQSGIKAKLGEAGQETAGVHVVESGLSAAPLNYKFPPEQLQTQYSQSGGGGGAGAGAGRVSKDTRSTATVKSAHRRTHSPARIGAAAVAALNEASTSLKETEHEHETSEAERAREACSVPPPAPVLTKGHKRNISLPSLQLYPRHSSSQSDSFPIEHKKPLTTVLNFASWQAYNPQLQKTISSQAGVRRHRRSRSASTFGVIDLNLVNQVRLPESDSRSSTKTGRSLLLGNDVNNRTMSQNNYDTDSDDQKTCSEPSAHTTPMKRPNFVDNLLNS